MNTLGRSNIVTIGIMAILLIGTLLSTVNVHGDGTPDDYLQTEEIIGGTRDANKIISQDIDGDGVPEIIIAHGYDSYTGGGVDIFSWKDGQYGIIQQVLCGPAHDVQVGDIDSDGEIEMVVLVGSTDPYPEGVGLSVYDILTGAQEWTWGSPYYSTFNDYYAFIEIVDLEGDGDNEVIMSDGYRPMVFDGATGTLEWTAPNAPLYNVAFLDNDCDGVLEMFAGGYYGCYIYDGATFQLEQQIPGRFLYALEIGDIDNDGELEMISGDYSGSYPYIYKIKVYDVLSGSLEWELSISYNYHYLRDLILEDVDLDGNTEMVIDWGYRVWVYDYVNRALDWEYLPAYYVYPDIYLVDVDDDGYNEIVFNDNQRLVFLDARTGVIEWSSDVIGYTNVMTINDFDGDGMTEICHTLGNMQIQIMEGATKNIEMTSPYQWFWNAQTAITDIDGDGEQEYIVSNSFGITVFSGVTNQPEATIGDPVKSVYEFEIADVDGDGCVEIVAVGGYWGVYLPNGQWDGYYHGFMWIINTADFTVEYSSQISYKWGYLYGVDVADLDGDGGQEIVVASYNEQYQKGGLRIFDGVTKNLEVYRTYSGYLTKVEIEDVDSDGEVEIVTPIGGSMCIIDPTSLTIEWSYQVTSYQWATIYSWCLEDIDGDCVEEILVPYNYMLFALDATSRSVEWTYTISPIGTYASNVWIRYVTAGDVDNDDVVEIAISVSEYLGYYSPIERVGYIVIVDPATDTLEWTSPYLMDQTSIAIGDVDGDGSNELVTLYGTYIRIFGSGGLTVEAGPDQLADEGDVVVFNGAVSGGEATAVTWDFGDGNTATGSLDVTHAYGDNGVYTVVLTVEDAKGGIWTDSCEVTVSNVAPTAGIDYQTPEPDAFPDLLMITEEITFLGLVDDPGYLDTHTFEWDLGNGVTSTEQNPTTAYDTPGNYTITMTVTDDDGASDATSIVVEISGFDDAVTNVDDYIQDLPDDAFSKNADQKKNTFSNKLDEVIALIEAGEYQEAINKLSNDIRPKVDSDNKNAWVDDPDAQQALLEMIDALIAYLETQL